MCFLWARNSAAPAGCDRVACRGSNLCSQAETVTEILGGVECARARARVSSCSELIKRARVSDQLICHGYSERGQRRRGLWRLWRAVTFSVRVEGLSLRTLCGAQLRWCAESGEVQRGAARVSPDIQRHNQRSNWKRGDPCCYGHRRIPTGRLFYLFRWTLRRWCRIKVKYAHCWTKDLKGKRSLKYFNP